jgi:hypothetical protein
MNEIQQYAYLIAAIMLALVLLIAYQMGKNSGKKTAVCLTTEHEVFQAAEGQINRFIDANFFRADLSDDDFAGEIAAIRAKWRPFITDIQKERLANKNNKKL